MKFDILQNDYSSPPIKITSLPTLKSQTSNVCWFQFPSTTSSIYLVPLLIVSSLANVLCGKWFKFFKKLVFIGSVAPLLHYIHINNFHSYTHDR